MTEAIKKAANSLVATWDFWKSNYVFLLIYFLKIYSIFYGVIVLLLIAFFMLISPVISYGYTALFANPFFASFAILLLAMLSFLNTTMYATSYIAIREKTKGKQISMLSKTKELFIPVVKYNLLYFLIILLPIILLGYADHINNELLTLSGILIIVAIVFIFQFALLELAMQKQQGTIESIKKSYFLIKENFLSTVVFDIILIGIVVMLALLFEQVQDAFSPAIFGFFISSTYQLPSLSSLIALFAIILIWFILQSAILGVVIISLLYFFWSNIKKPITQKSVKIVNQHKRKK